MQTSKEVRVGLIGYGYAGVTFHAPLIRTVKGMRLAMVSSSKPEAVQRDYPSMAVVGDPAELINAADIDLVVIASTNATHYPLAKQAILAGKHVVVEKPFTVTVQEAAELVDLAEQRKVILSVFHNRRWDSDFLTLRQTIEAGLLGQILTYESHFDRYRPAVRPRGRQQDQPGAGHRYDHR